jgi:hypothetical protein
LTFLATGNQAEKEVLPLRDAVFCLDCEAVSKSRSDECPACKSRSLLSLSRLLGGSLRESEPSRALEKGAFDITLTVKLRQMHANDLNTTLENLTKVIGPRLARGCASFHIDVQPAVDRSVNRAA